MIGKYLKFFLLISFLPIVIATVAYYAIAIVFPTIGFLLIFLFYYLIFYYFAIALSQLFLLKRFGKSLDINRTAKIIFIVLPFIVIFIVQYFTRITSYIHSNIYSNEKSDIDQKIRVTECDGRLNGQHIIFNCVLDVKSDFTAVIYPQVLDISYTYDRNPGVKQQAAANATSGTYKNTTTYFSTYINQQGSLSNKDLGVIHLQKGADKLIIDYDSSDGNSVISASKNFGIYMSVCKNPALCDGKFSDGVAVRIEKIRYAW